MKNRLDILPRRRVQRWLYSTLGTRQRLRPRTVVIFAALIFLLSFVTKSLQAVDLAPLMYTEGQPFGGLTRTYDERAVSILNGEGLLGPYDVDARNTMWLAQAPGYAVFLSAIYKITSRDFYNAQLAQNLFNSLSPVLMFLIAGMLLGWRVGIAAGVITAVSHHLSYISNFMLPDALCALPILSAVFLVVLSRRRRRYDYLLFALAGVALGAAAWLRPQPMLAGPFFALMLILLAARRWRMLKRAAVLAIVALIMIAPITVKNYKVYGAFIPVSIGTGLNLWEGIGEASDYGFGAVAKDTEVAAQEAELYQNPEYGEAWSYPDGIKRDRDRVKKSLRVIRENPVWYAGVMLKRAGEMMKYSAHASLIFRAEEVGKTENTEPVPRNWRLLEAQSSDSSLVIGKSMSWTRAPLRAAQRLTKETMLPFVVLGAGLTLLLSRRRFGLLFLVPLYYFILQSAMHTEFRYTLPMQYFLFTFAAVAWVVLMTLLAGIVRHLIMRRRKASKAAG